MIATSLLALLVASPAPVRLEDELVLVETTPAETTLGSDAVPETVDVWLEMIGSAEDRIDLAFFYASNEAGSSLERVVLAIEAAADRGVSVRFLGDKKFYETYPGTLDRLDARDNVEMRLLDLSEATGGVLHAKYFVVDLREAYMGSANFDWRSLEHIQELGLRVRVPEIARAFGRVFADDWRFAGGEPAPRPASHTTASSEPVAATFDGAPVRVRALASPEGLLPAETSWDLPAMLAAIDGATEEVRVQLLSYATTSRDGAYFADLDTALRRAAARGVQVKLLLADWSKRSWSIEPLKSLQVLGNVEVRLVSVPEAEAGFIPFARVVHAKYMVADGTTAWLGTSNWSGDYFHASRNLGLLVEGASFGGALRDFHERTWSSGYVETVDPGKTYTPPRIGQ